MGGTRDNGDNDNANGEDSNGDGEDEPPPTVTDRGTTTRKTKKKGPRDDVNVVSWAIGQFFFLSSFRFLY